MEGTTVLSSCCGQSLCGHRAELQAWLQRNIATIVSHSETGCNATQALSSHEQNMAHQCEACSAPLFWRSMLSEGTSSAVPLV